MTTESDVDYSRGWSSPRTDAELEPGEWAASDRTTTEAEDLLTPLDADQDPLLSVVLPTLDEEEGITECIERIKESIVELDVTAEIVLSDSSTDRTPEIARENGAIVYEPDRPGYGAAYRHAFERVRGQFVAMGDADTTYDFRELPKLFEKVAAGEADMVLGSRLEGTIEDGAMPKLHQYVGNPLLTKFLNAFYDAGVSDAHSGMRVMTREALDTMELETDGMEFASEMIMEAGAKGLTISEVPIGYYQRSGEPKLDSFRDGWRHVKFMLVNAPSYIFHVPAAVLTLVGVLTLGISLSMPGTTLGPIYVGHITAVVGSIATVVGFQVGVLAVFSTVAGNPIREPADPVSRWVLDGFRLEHGASAGLCLLAAGCGLLSYFALQWVTSGYTADPDIVPMIVALTAVVSGANVLFSSFFISLIGTEQAAETSRFGVGE